MNITELVHDAVIASDFGGVNFEKFLNKPIRFFFNGQTQKIVRVVVRNDDLTNNVVLVHLLNDEDETDWTYFDKLEDNIKGAIYADIFHHKVCDIDEFFELIKNFLEDGDKMFANYELEENGEIDYDNLVYTIRNQCDDMIGEYHTKYQLYKRF